MARGVYVVCTRPADPSCEDEMNAWYDHTHLPELLAVPGFVSARRFRRVDADGEVEYLAVYEVDAPDIGEPVRELRRRSAAGETTPPTAVRLDPPPDVALYEELT